MSQLQSIITFSDSGSNANVNATRLNSHVNDSTLLNGAILDQSEKTTPVSADVLLLGDSTVAASGVPKKVQIGNLLLESQRNGTQQYAAAGSGSDAYTVTLSPAPTAYTAGMVVRFKADVANTGAATLNVNSLGAKDIRNRNAAALTTGDIVAGEIVQVVYDGTQFLLNGLSKAESDAAILAARASQYSKVVALATALGASNVNMVLINEAHSLGAIPTKVFARLRCTSTDLGYAVNDEVDLASVTFPPAVIANATNIIAIQACTSVPAVATPQVRDRTSGTTLGLSTNITLTKWSLAVYASL